MKLVGNRGPCRAFSVVVAGIHLVSRLALLASVVVVERGDYTRAVILAMAAALILLVERVVISFRRLGVESDVLMRVVRALFGSRDLVSTFIPRAVVLTGVFDQARVRVEIVPMLIGDALAAIGVFVFAMARQNLTRLAVMVVITASVAITIALMRSRLRNSSRVAWASYEAHVQRVLDGLDSAVDIVASGQECHFAETMEVSLRGMRRASRAAAIESAIVGRIPFVAAGACALVFVEIVAPTRTGLSLEWAVLAAMIAPFVGMASEYASYLQTAESRHALDAVLSAPQRTHGTVRPKWADEITFKEVTVRYADHVALQVAALRIDDGITALHGPNGSGKTTLLRALAGLVAVEGDARVGSTALHEIDWFSARADIAVLMQKPTFGSDTTVRAAMAMVCGSTGDPALQAALERIEVWSVLEQRNDRDPLATQVDDLSAGERQRVAIARVLAREAHLYLLDEPDANLDGAGLEVLRHVLVELSEHAKVIIAAHTPELLNAAHTVIEMKDSSVVSVRQLASARTG